MNKKANLNWLLVLAVVLLILLIIWLINVYLLK